MQVAAAPGCRSSSTARYRLSLLPPNGCGFSTDSTTVAFLAAPYSGAPAISWKVFGVVSGYRTEPTEVIPLDPAVKPAGRVNVNSGFFVAYDIGYAVDAIKKNPIGPIREQNQ